MASPSNHPLKKLTAVGARALSEPGRYSDGNGLYLVIEKAGSKHWVQRIVVLGRRRDIGLGSLKLVSLVEARDKAHQNRKVARAGGDPTIEHRRSKVKVPTFQEAAEKVHKEHKAAWRNAKHTDQWMMTLKTYAFPILSSRRVDQIESADILRVLSPIWLLKPETARRVRQRIKMVLDWAKAAGHRLGENPVDDALPGLPKQPDRKRHHKALPYHEVPEFIKNLRASPSNETVRLAFEFLILTAARTGEVIKSTWDEIDFDDALWIVPATRTKNKKEHRVPLCSRALEIIRRTNELSPDGRFVFPGRSKGASLSNMAVLQLISRTQYDITTHGFRSTFRDWVSEKTDFSSDLAEMALAHSIPNKVEAAYRRGNLVEKRREMMLAWQNACSPK